MLTPLVVMALALSPVQAYNQGNQLYARRDYEGAARAYEAALAGGASAAVRYNLGNALFKAGHVGRAILEYRRARYLDPRDPDIAANLEFARSYRADKLPAATSPIARALDAAFHRLSRTEAALLAALAALLAALSLAVWIVRRWAVFLAGAAAVGLVALWAFATQLAWSGEVDAHPAVVVVPEARALSGPGEDFKDILLLHDGTEVRIRETRGDYVLAQLPGGAGGWLRREAIERVY